GLPARAAERLFGLVRRQLARPGTAVRDGSGLMATRRGPRSRRDIDRPKGLHTWRIYLARAKGEFLGTCEAPVEKTAMQTAAEEFKLSPVQAARLLVQRVAER